MVLPKRKVPVTMPLMLMEEEVRDGPFTETTEEERDVHSDYSEEITHRVGPSRVCTPSPPLSPLRDSCPPPLLWNHHSNNNNNNNRMEEDPLLTVAKQEQQQPQQPPKSILRPSKKRRKLLHYRDTKELVDPLLDGSIASTYELTLFSHMTMKATTCTTTTTTSTSTTLVPGFQCRLCRKVSFACRSWEDVDACIPRLDQHLRGGCGDVPDWVLVAALDRSKPLHESERSPPHKPYTLLLWKRLLAHAVYSNMEFPPSRRVQFAKQHQQRIIPGIERARSYKLFVQHHKQQQQQFYHHMRRRRRQRQQHRLQQQQQQQQLVHRSLQQRQEQQQQQQQKLFQQQQQQNPNENRLCASPTTLTAV